MSASSPATKKRRVNNNTISTIFNNPKDEKQCIGLINILNSCIKIKIDRYIIKEIAEYSTGELVKCKHDMHKSIPHTVTGWIHHLHGNNFDPDKAENYENKLLLHNYQCEDAKCTAEAYIFDCKTCDKRTHVNKCQENGNSTSKTHDLQPYRSCSMDECHGIYCATCCSKSGVYCVKCVCFHCNDCSKLNGGCCGYCCDYYCGDCGDFINEPIDLCNDCKMAIHIARFGDERSRNKAMNYLSKFKGDDKQ